MRWLAILALWALSPVPGFATEPAPSSEARRELAAIGQRIYRDGILPTGQALQGVGQAGVTLTGKDAACTTCHRRSGYGSSEGQIEVRSITGPALFGERVAPVAPGSEAASSQVATPAPAAPSGQSAAATARAQALALRAERAAMFAGTRPRPAYDETTLARAIRDGVDVTGRSMDRAMPRFGLDATALTALTAYLKSLSTTASPGVTEDQVHFATVIQPGTTATQRAAVVDVLQAYFRDRNQGQRAEVRRERAGQVHLGRTYREWVLHVWELTGPGDSWGAQLEALYRQQPVFALVSGVGKANWRPIHEFSERLELPCVLPQADVPVIDAPDIYTVYLSQGVTLEAQALAKYLRDTGEPGPVWQVYRSDDASATAAAAFAKAWSANGRSVQERRLDAAPDANYWRQLASEAAGATLILWLGPDDLAQQQVLTAAPSTLKAVYLSAGLSGDMHGVAPDGGSDRMRIVYPYDLPAARATRLAVVKRWLQTNGIAPTEERVQLNAYLAATVLGMVVTHSKDTYSRDFLLERMEHRLGTAFELSIYPRLSLGPGQRFASKGSYIAGLEGGGAGQLSLLSEWIVP